MAISSIRINNQSHDIKDKNAISYPTANMAKLAAKRMTYMNPSTTEYNTITNEMKEGFLDGSYDGWKLGQVLKDADTGLGWTVVDFDELNGCVVLACLDIPNRYNHANEFRFWDGTIVDINDDPTAFRTWRTALFNSVDNVIGESTYIDFLLNASYIPGINDIGGEIFSNFGFRTDRVLASGTFKVSSGVLFAKARNIFQNFNYRYDYRSFATQVQSGQPDEYLGEAMIRINDNPVANPKEIGYGSNPIDTTNRTFSLFKNQAFRNSILNGLYDDVMFNDFALYALDGPLFSLVYDIHQKRIISRDAGSAKMLPCLFVKSS